MRVRWNLVRGGVAVGTALTIAMLGGWSAQSATAAGTTRYVATTGDDTDNDCTDQSNPCLTIQNGIDQADSGDTVSIAVGKYDESVLIRKSVTLVGAGTASSAGTNKTTIDGDGEDDPSIGVDGSDVDTTVVVTIKNLDVSGNKHDDGIFVNDEATATVQDSVVSNNIEDGVDLNANRALADSATRDQADDVLPSVTLSGDTITGNGSGVDDEPDGSGVAVNSGAAAIGHSDISGNADGGVVVEEGAAVIDTSTLDANVGAGLVADGGGTEATLTNSTVSNTVPFTRDDAEVFGGGVLVFPGGVATIDTSTLSANTGQGVLSAGGDVTIDNSTISNTVRPKDEDGQVGGLEDLPYGGVSVTNEEPDVRMAGLRAFAGGAKHASAVTPKAATHAGVSLLGTIVADNTSLDDCNGSVTDDGYNLASDKSCDFTATGSVNKGIAKLGPLADNGGLTKTLKPAKGSDAIDAIPTGQAGCSTTAKDQRGVSRPQGAKCDIGAVEDAQPPIVVSPKALPNGKVGKAYSVKLTATGGLGAPYEFSLATGSSLPPGLTLDSSGSITGAPTTAGTFTFTVSVDDPVLKTYTIVVAAAPSTSTSPVLSNTGANVTPLTIYGVLALTLGLLLTFGGLARYAGRHRTH